VKCLCVGEAEIRNKPPREKKSKKRQKEKYWSEQGGVMSMGKKKNSHVRGWGGNKGDQRGEGKGPKGKKNEPKS